VDESLCMTGPGWRAWLTGWVGAVGIGVVNGVIRDRTYGRRLGEASAHRVSTGTLIAALLPYTMWLERREPLPGNADAVLVGVGWAGLTAGFEFGLGRARGLSWAQAAADYNLARGRLWPLVLIALALGPVVARKLRTAGR
jgi:hypothetical protein